jgi:hypothetical protein
MTAAQYLDAPLVGWFVLDVMRKKARSWDWVALMIDVHPDDFIAHRANPKEPGRWVRIPGKHRHRDAAWDALEDMLETRH